MKKLLPILALAMLFISSCSIEERIIRREDRLTGTWIVERAFFNWDGALFRDNITNEFRGDRVTFFPDYSLEYVSGTGEVFQGVWFIDAFRDREDDLEFTIDADFFDARGSLAFRWVGEITLLTQNNFNVNIAERNGILRIRWDKL
jgi:hypothetical protein